MTVAGSRNGISRRRLMKAAGWTAAGVTVVYLAGRHVMPVLPSFSAPGAAAGAAWLQVRADGGIAMWCPVHDLGQGSSTALAQIVAEEMNVAAHDIDIRLPSTRDIPAMRFTTGSQGIALHARPLARAAAALREELRRRAAQRLGLPVDAIADKVGGFEAPDGVTIAYRDIVRGAAVVLDAATLQDAASYVFDGGRTHRQVGRPVPVAGDRDIVVGRPAFAPDLRLDGMAYGRAVQAPLPGARITLVRENDVRSLPGVIAVVVDRVRDFVGVVAATPRALERAMDAIEVVWETPPVPSRRDVAARVDVDRSLAAGGGALEHRILADALTTDAPWDVDLRVDLPALHHVAQEPRAAVARFGKRDGTDIVEIWTGSQDVFVNQKKAAKELGWSADRVIVHLTRAGGAFGGRALYDVVRDAILLARAANRPVKVQWSRADEFVADRTRPPSSHRIRVRADDQGHMTDWWHAVVGGHVVLTDFLAPPWLLAPLRLAIADFGATRGIVPPYAAGRRRVELADLDLPLHVGPWRSLGATPNSTAIELAIDALARKLGRDPVDVRLRNLPPSMVRLAGCLTRVRDLCEAVPRPAVEGFGRGYACGVFHDHSFVAASFDVVVERTDRRIRPLRACCVLDVGLAVNPDRIRAQTEGCIMMAIGQVLMEAAPIGDIGFAARHFGDYPTPTLADAPRFEIDIVQNPQTAPAGVGETALIAAVPALANAVGDAIGRPIVRLPIRRDDLGGVTAAG